MTERQTFQLGPGNSLIRVFSRNSRASLFVLLALCFACTKPDDRPASNLAAARETKNEQTELHTAIKKVEPFFKRIGKPAAYDWLASHNEPGQTFNQYLDAGPERPTKERNKIYVLPLGTFTPQQKKIIDIATGYLEAFYDLPVSMMPARNIKRPLSVKDSRLNKTTHKEQVRTGYILDSVLRPALPADGAALIAFTADDLYASESTNYLFGEASFENHVGVWSLFRLGDNANYDTFLRRTLKIAAHETGHMFSMRHCTKYVCVMCGTNHLGETDSHPIDACPECMAKVCWLSNIAPKDRYEKLAAFCRKNGLNREADEFELKSAAVKNI